MKKHFKLIDLDCANCAAKMEDAIRKIEGVDYVSVSFLSQMLRLTAADYSCDAVVKEAVKACRKIEPDCTVVL